MCGVTGWVDFERDLSSEHATAGAMTRTMACRGPDDEGLWLGRHAALGHRRLAVIDPEHGRQPMHTTAGDGSAVVITFSGEIYNFRELRAELASYGHRFHTHCDTEVVLRGYVQWGRGLAERLNGMYAFAVWDEAREELLLVRDRMGVKPLYYHPTPHGVLFGSEPKAVLAHPSVTPRVTADGLCEVLDMVKTPGRTVFSGMYEVRPGELVVVGSTGLTRRTYWKLEAHEHPDDLNTTIATVRDLLADTVTRQLVSDVPLCTLLSGGLDSSAVTALAARGLRADGKGPVRTFSVDFTGAGSEFEPDAVRKGTDAPFVREMVRHVGADHTAVLLDSDRLAASAVRDAVLAATDLPPAYWGDMWPSLYLFFQQVRRHCTVALSGEAADELFGGYQWFHRRAAVQADTFPWLTSGSARYFGGRGLFDRTLLDKLDLPGYQRARYEEARDEVPVLPGENERERTLRRVSYLNLTRFVQTLLDRKDRMSMATGLEVRVPFCDHRLVEYVFNVPWETKTFDGREKSLLRAAATDLLPHSVLTRVKTPYPATQDPAYERLLRQELADVLADGEAPIRELLDLEKAGDVLRRPVGAVSRPYDRGSMELVLWMNTWLSTYNIRLEL
ncbi:asparagine synthase (glutamine-hydrolyzing) [Streptomyces platensis]|uniref:asparagine synthase (glutamine-hydrolyzing) n=1 Tax=Streptomyces platensis TaxID=58346 RepID=A0AAE6TQC1_STRPT|nr:asparagine synthase (glutamine-hydrolyzing) [Streptomyces platensis]OSY48327.1 Asparagine synthetase [glutamine-hydrolyzing] 3 [Streptomyces platensis]QEV56041.1 asparagine synthase (glutamine-hydrolyzing) [Streptomyces platensis]